MKKSYFKKYILRIIIFSVSFFVTVGVLYNFGLPIIVSNPAFIKFVEQKTAEYLNADIKITNPKLKTGVDIAFSVDELTVNKDGQNYLTLSDIDTLISLKELYKKRIIVKKVLADSIYIDTYNLIKIIPKNKKDNKKTKSFFTLDMYNILLGVKKCTISHSTPTVKLNFTAKHAIFDRTQNRKFLHFDFDLFIEKEGYKITVSADDKNKIFMENGVAYIKSFPIAIEDSDIVIDAYLTKNNKYELNVAAKKFKTRDIVDILNSNLFVADGRKMIEPLTDINGSVNFNVTMSNDTFKGNVNINETTLKIKPLLNLPVNIYEGRIDIDEKNIYLKNFNGYYNNLKTNTLAMEGEIKDYHNTCDTLIKSDIFVTNDFFKNYLSKMLGSPVQLVGDSMSKLIIKSKTGNLNILWFFLLKENHGFKFGEQSMVLKDYKTFFKVDLSIIKNILKINTIDYHITKELKRGMTPLVQINGNIDLADNMKILDLNIDMPKPLPSEFLNFIACQKIFKKGNVSGKMHVDNSGKYAVLNGIFKFDKVIVPAQRTYIKSAQITAADNKISLVSNGKFRRTNYNFDGYIANELRLPIIVKNVNLTLDNIDVEKLLQQPNIPGENSNENLQNTKDVFTSKGTINEEEEPLKFQKGLVIVEKCGLNLQKGVYKEINFGNLHADMTLNNDGILTLKSNRFDIADGISSLKIVADLVNGKYNLKLGIKDVDSNIIATAMLGLPRQISGKAKGLIDINTDSSLKLNGDIKFKINNGTIEQVGYVEYILKAASLFRNPLAMITPATIIDLVNIPEGQFNEIAGEMKLENNIIKRMKIKSSADELAALIIGRYDLTTNDAMLRIYTKFSSKKKGFAGFLRNLSLNTIASKISISARNDSNYYANELEQIPELVNGEDTAQVFLTKIDGDILNFNFLSSLKRIK